MSKNLPKKIFLLLALFGIFTCTYLYVDSEGNNFVEINKGIQIAYSGPVHIKIPKINVDAVIESVGLTPGGAVGVPKGPKEAAWFNLGPKPGEEGNSIIDGHSGWKNGIPAVFDNLYKLKKGDEIYIKDEKGIINIFIVREIKKYKPDASAQDVFVSTDGKSHLNLITCTGIWNKIAKSRSSRLVVFADKK